LVSLLAEPIIKINYNNHIHIKLMICINMDTMTKSIGGCIKTVQWRVPVNHSLSSGEEENWKGSSHQKNIKTIKM
jgi:hypothetical protein